MVYTAQYPGAIVTPADWHEPEQDVVNTTLANSITNIAPADGGSLEVNDATAFSQYGGFVRVNEVEIIEYSGRNTGVTPHQLTGITRGVAGTSAAGAPAGASVKEVVSHLYLERIYREVEAVQGTLGINPTFGARMALVFPASAAEVPATGGPQVVEFEGTNRGWFELAFDDTAEETCYFSAEVPNYYSASNTLRMALKWRAAATAGNVLWRVNIAAVASGESGDVAGTDYTFAVDVTDAVSEADNQVILTGVASPFASGDRLSIGVSRVAGDVNDDLVGDAKLLSLTIEEE